MTKVKKTLTLPVVKVVEEKADEKLFKKIKAVCLAFPHVEIIYVDQKTGEYHFHAIPGFTPVDAKLLRDDDDDNFEVDEEPPVIIPDPEKPEPPVTIPSGNPDDIKF